MSTMPLTNCCTYSLIVSMDGVRAGIAKINVGTEIRQAYEQALNGSGGDIPAAQAAVYLKVCQVIRDMLEMENTRTLLFEE